MRIDRAIVDLREHTSDPLEAAYRAGAREYLIDVPLSNVRMLQAAAFRVVGEHRNPFIDTLLSYAAGRVSGYAASPLEQFYHNFRPRTAAEVLGLDAGHSLANAPPIAFVFPWSGQSPRDAENHWRVMIEKDNLEHGLRAPVSQGWKGWGPVHSNVGELEYRRLTTLFDAMRADGYARNSLDDGDIRGTVLWRDGEFCVSILSGHHRIAALGALGAKSAPIRLAGVQIRGDDVQSWPNVRSGLFGAEDATNLFERIFEGRQPF
jgi:hypothetical protein